ncbi:hypothetical protein HXX76_002672 [Chlamydomonas incerta]|uniref:Non-structural maintenance of chromosomes element 1 homolog n=1 Tax=Chlamydomonas incerta TaxID=51695 RepID=A0A835W6Q4_CHLIN|nr:hypothetical protein HXX76_002672 [Chlamydomonas incerta]|eukprot:KAG2442587.1 hypothetical protein HXX76_002672 [Chlamydomonas incerta]
MPVLSKIQKDLQWLDMNIERIKLPVNDEWYLCAVNKEPDEASKQMGGAFTIAQMDYFRAVVDKIGSQPPEGDELIAEVNSIILKNVEPAPATGAAAGAAGGSGGAAGEPGTQAAAAARAPKPKMLVSEREDTLRKLTNHGWLFMARDGYYTLGPRTLTELKELVMSTLPAEAAERLSNNYM